jgi:hypothetical protein
MSDVLSNDDLKVLAAEYVLGTLDFEERKGAAALLEVDPAFRGTVRIWERRLGELHLMVEPVAPDLQVWERIKEKVLGLAPEAFAPPPPPEPEVTEADAPADGTPTTEPPEAVSDTPAPEALTPAESDAVPPEAIEAGASAATAQSIAPDAAANLMRELEEAALMVSPTPSAKTAEPGASIEDQPDAAKTDAATEIPSPPLVAEEVAADEPGKASPPLRRWRVFAVAMSLVAVALAGLIGAWRFIPDQLPERLQATNVLHLPVPAPPPPPLPPPRRDPPPSFEE